MLNSDSQIWEFKHPNFKRGAVLDLQYIKRRVSTKNVNNTNETANYKEDENYGPLYKHMLDVEEKLIYVSQSYDIVKKEMNILKSVLSRQQETLNEFTQLFTDLLADNNIVTSKFCCLLNKLQIITIKVDLSDMKKDFILFKLNQLQSLLFQDNRNTNIQKMGFGKESYLLNPREEE